MLEINFNDILENLAENNTGKFKVAESDVIYDFLQALGLDVVSGCYDPEIDKRNGEVDELTGYYYVGING